MKHKLLITKTLVCSCFFVLTLLCSNLKAQNANPAYQEVLVFVKQADEKNTETIRQRLRSAGGVVVSGYCGQQHIFYMLVDRNVHADDLFLDGIFRSLNLTFEPKIGVSIAQAQAACSNGYIAYPLENHSSR